MSGRWRLAVLSAAALSVLVLGCPTPFGYYSAGNRLVSPVESPTSTSATPAATPLFFAAPASGGTAVIVAGSPSEDRDQLVTFSCETEGASIYYTTDGSTPDPNKPATHLYSPSQPIKILGNGSVVTIKAIAFKALMLPSAMATVTVTISYNQASSPAFSLAGGTYASVQTVTITDSTLGATIWYTTDGSAPIAGVGTTVAALAPASLTVDRTMTVRAIASAPSYANSNEASVSYTLQPAAPSYSLAAGTYTSVQTVTISAVTPGSVVWYTTDGSAPTAGAPSLGGTTPVTVAVNGTMAVRAITAIAGWTPSVEVSRAYVLQPSPPVYSLAAGSYNTEQSVTITAPTAGSVIWYTTNGTAPTVGAPSLGGTAPITLPVTVSTQVRAITSITNWTPSTEAARTYTLVCLPPTMPGNATMLGIESINLTAMSGNDIVWYTTNGTTPTAGAPSLGGTGSSATVPIRRSVTLQAIAARSGWQSSVVASATYTTGLQLYYSFDDAGLGTAIDGSGNGWNGTVTNATPVTGHNGVLNSAYSFNGTSSTVAASGSIFSSTPNVSFSAWVYISSGVSGLHYFIMVGGIGVFETTTTGPAFGLAISVPGTSSTGYVVTTTGAWHHLAGTYDGTTISFYLDGQLAATGTNSGSADGAGSITIGYFNGTYWPGIVDELRIYNRTLSPTEITTLYNTP